VNCCVFWALFELLTCYYENPFRRWIAVCLLSIIWIADTPSWNTIQKVSCCVPPGLHLDCWHTTMKSHPVSELLYAFWAPFGLLTCTMKSHPVGELLCASWASYEFLTCPHKILFSQWVAVGLLGSICNFELLTCHYKILSRQWVAVCLLASIWIFDMPLWSRRWVAMCLLASIWISDMPSWNPI